MPKWKFSYFFRIESLDFLSSVILYKEPWVGAKLVGFVF